MPSLLFSSNFKVTEVYSIIPHSIIFNFLIYFRRFNKRNVFYYSPFDETHLDAVRRLILLRRFHFQYLLIVGCRQEGHPAIKTASNTKDLCCIKDNMLNTQKPGQGDRSADYTKNRKRQYVKLRIVTLNVVTMRGRSTEIIEMLSKHNVDICCVQETCWKGESAQNILGKNCHYNLFWVSGEMVA